MTIIKHLHQTLVVCNMVDNHEHHVLTRGANHLPILIIR